MIDRNRGALPRWRGRACASTQGVEDPWQGRERVFESNGVFSSLIKEAMGFGKDGSRGRDPTPALGPAEVADPGLASEAALQGDHLERSMKSFQNRLNSSFFPLCICTALAYLCT
jgi:hypothetical protein